MQSSNTTTVATVTTGGAATALILWVAGQLGVEMDVTVATAIVVLVTGLVGTFLPKKDPAGE
jgi:hypothetical protein